MTTPVPLDVFSPELMPGETLEWTGRPNPAVVFHREDWLVIPFSLLFGGFAIFWLLAWEHPGSGTSGSNRTFDYLGLLMGTPFVLIGQYMTWGRFLYRRWEKQGTYYALTNRRALIVHIRLGGRASSSAFLANLPVVDKRARADGIGRIGFGDPARVERLSGEDNLPRRPTFDDVDDVDSVYQIAVRLHNQARKSTGTLSSR